MSTRVQICVNHASKKQRYAGWSNTFFNLADPGAGLRAQALDLAQRINDAMGSESVPVLLKYALLSTGENKILAAKRRIALDRTDFTPPRSAANLTSSSTPEKCLVMRDFAETGERTWFLNGIPDDLEKFGGDYQPTSVYAPLVGAIGEALASGLNTWKLRLQDRTVAHTAITGVTATGIVTTQAAHGLITGQWVRIVGSRYASTVPGRDRMNGRWKITKLTDLTFQLPLSSSQVMSQDWEGNPEVYPEKLVLVDYKSPDPGLGAVRVVRSGSHPVGRPFDPHTGRRTR